MYMNENPIGDFVNRLEAETEPTPLQLLGMIGVVMTVVAGAYFIFS